MGIVVPFGTRLGVALSSPASNARHRDTVLRSTVGGRVCAAARHVRVRLSVPQVPTAWRNST
jgi:hypothetical protein